MPGTSGRAAGICRDSVDARRSSTSALGLNTVTVAGSYHAGKFLRPQGHGGQGLFPGRRHGLFPRRPDALRHDQAGREQHHRRARHLRASSAEAGGIAVNAWMVLLHNTRLGEAYPDATVENAFGDRYVYSLCPSAPGGARLCGRALQGRDRPLSDLGISVEAPGFAPYAHGFHHEFALIKQNRWLDSAARPLLLRPLPCRSAASAGIDADGLRARVARRHRVLSRRRHRPSRRHGRGVLAGRYAERRRARRLPRLALRRRDVAGRARSGRRSARTRRSPSSPRWRGRPAAPGTRGPTSRRSPRPPASSRPASTSRAPERVRADAWDVKRRIGGDGTIRGILRPAHPDLNSARRGGRRRSPGCTRPASTTSPSTITAICRRPSLDWIARCARRDWMTSAWISRARSSRSPARRAASVRRSAATSRDEGAKIARHRQERRRSTDFARELAQEGIATEPRDRRHRRRRRRSAAAFARSADALGAGRHPGQQCRLLARIRPRSAPRRRIWRDDVNGNLNGAYYCAHAVLPGMKAEASRRHRQYRLGQRALGARRPRLQRRQGRHDQPHPVAGAWSIGRYGIRVNIVCPGTVRTPIWERARRRAIPRS